ncbi:MAG: hypothetical protein ABSH44_07870 [Bryobacteraceae bacterium]
MVNCAHFARFATLIALVMAAISCRSITAPAAVDRGMASSIPADTLFLAGFSLDEIRASPLYSKLPPAVGALAEPLRDAGYLLLASNGKDLFSIVRGRFREAPAGATLIAPGLAIAGPPESIRAATEQHKTGRSGAPDLLAQAASVAAGKQVWMVARGGVTLPFAGNAANLNRLLRNLEYATMAIALGSRVELGASGIGRTAEASREFEENLRAILSLAAAANARAP